MLTITVKNCPLPCPANRLYRAFVAPGTRYPRQILSADARKRRILVVAHILKKLKHRPMIDVPLALHYTVHPRDKRLPDVDAYEKHLLDCLQHAGVVTNDKIICQVTKERLEPQMPGWIDFTLSEVT